MSGGRSAILGVTAAPVRAEPSHRSERITEWLCGEVLRVVAHEDDWILLPPDDGTPPRSANRLPWGGRARSSAGGRVMLPDGAEAMPRDPERLVPDHERAARYPATGSAVVRSAAEWLGAPYAWGGRRRSGVDCSGLAQAVYALHGVDLPRDSGPQREAGHDLSIDSDGWMRLGPGDLLFFAPEGRGITHVAICLGSGLILHAAASNGSSITSLSLERKRVMNDVSHFVKGSS